MASGTITVTNGSKSVVGTNSSFNTEVFAGGYLVFQVAGIDYTLPVDNVTSPTQLMLASPYTGQTATVTYSYIFQSTMAQVTAGIVSQNTEALRGMNFDKRNWQQFFTNTGDYTVTVADGSQFTGPSAKKLTDQYAAIKVKTDALGNSSTRNVGTTSGTVAAGDDSRLNTIAGKTGGSITGRIGMSSGGIGTYLSAQQNAAIVQGVANDNSATSAVGALTWQYNNGAGFQIDNTWGSVGLGASAWPQTYLMQAANATNFGARIWTFGMSSGDIICSGSGSQGGSFIFTKASNSDRTLKHDITYTDGQTSVANVRRYLPTTFIYNDDIKNRIRRGFIAQDLKEIDPEYVKEIQNPFTMETTLALDTNVILLDVAIAMNVYIDKIDAQEKEIDALKKEIADLSAAVAKLLAPE